MIFRNLEKRSLDELAQLCASSSVESDTLDRCSDR
jgi:hypothetical protein